MRRNLLDSILSDQRDWAKKERDRNLSQKERKLRKLIHALIEVVRDRMPEGEDRDILNEFLEFTTEHEADYEPIVWLMKAVSEMDIEASYKILAAKAVINIRQVQKLNRESR